MQLKAGQYPYAKLRILVCILAGLLTFAIFHYSPVAVADSEQDLSEVRERIRKLQKDINKSTIERDKLQRRLAEAERLISKLQNNIAQLNQERTASEARLKQLEAKQLEQLENLELEKKQLSAQIYAAYVGGREEKLKLLLNQKNPSELGRVVVYYRYLNEHRVKGIDAVNAIISEIEQLSAQAALENKSIKRLQKLRHLELESLKNARKNRLTAVANVNKKIKNEASHVAQLKNQEKDLLKLIMELDQIMNDYPVGNQSSFTKLKGELAWPLKGKLLAGFGQSRGGTQISWDGVLIGTNRGTPVRAIARGRVAYADWLPGQGLLVVIEHGDNYISLYGRNETLNAKPGDWIEAGDVVATAGDSGGQSRVALYFALRKKGKAINPKAWFKHSVSKG